MPGGGELRAFFKGAQEDAAQAVESAAGKMAEFGGKTAQKVRDSVSTLGHAEGANTDAANAIRSKAGSETGNLPGSGGTEASGSGMPGGIKRILDGEGEPAPVPKKARSLPPQVKKRLEEGRAFNEENWSRYPHNEVTLESGKRVDSYVPRSEIVERKHTQLGSVKPETAKSYIDSLRNKYEPGQAFKDSPKNQEEGLAGRTMRGRHILEVPPQDPPVPSDILRHAAARRVIIRDTNGKVYR